MGERYLYVMISETGTTIGKLIRRFSGYRYNHCAVTLDESLRTWQSFARFHRDSPFYGGFLNESVERYLAKGKSVPVKIFRIEITPEREEELRPLLEKAGTDSGYLYNYYDVLAALFGKRLRIPKAYTCLSFTCRVLQREYVTIEQLDCDMAPTLYWKGELSDLVLDSKERTDRYFTAIGFVRGNYKAAGQLARVTARLLRKFARI